MLYLLQLVQALKFESITSDQKSSRSANSAISQEDSGLADFLIERAIKNPVFGTRFNWYLMVEIEICVEDKVTSKLYAKVGYRFQNKIAEVSLQHMTRLLTLWVDFGDDE
jgi:phosphatidylinositol 3-kinase